MATRGKTSRPRYIPRDREKGTPRPRGVTRATTRSPFPTRARNVRADQRGAAQRLRPPIRDGGIAPDDIVTGAIYCANCGKLRPPVPRSVLARACIIWESRWKIVRTARRPRFVFRRPDARLRGRGRRFTPNALLNICDPRVFDLSISRDARRDELFVIRSINKFD